MRPRDRPATRVRARRHLAAKGQAAGFPALTRVRARGHSGALLGGPREVPSEVQYTNLALRGRCCTGVQRTVATGVAQGDVGQSAVAPGSARRCRGAPADEVMKPRRAARRLYRCMSAATTPHVNESASRAPSQRACRTPPALQVWRFSCILVGCTVSFDKSPVRSLRSLGPTAEVRHVEARSSEGRHLFWLHDVV
jgi:hypothetical protein